MRFDWEVFKTYDDGSQSTRCNGKIYRNNGRKYSWGWIEDHTKEAAKEDDKEVGRNVYYAYLVHGFENCLSSDALRAVFKEHGFSEDEYGSAGFSSMGICPNENYRENPHEYTGTPKCTAYDVMRMVEEAVVKTLSFDYEAELAEYKERLDKRQAIMDEAVDFLKKRDSEV
nr:hypothetical protein [uncultured Butyrivibrio sp.]